MLELSLFGFEFYKIKNQYVIFYGNQLVPHNSIFNIDEAVKITCQWIIEQHLGYNGPTASQFKEAAESLINA